LSLSNIFSIICLANFFLLELVFSITKLLSPFALFFFGLFFLLLPAIILYFSASNIGKTFEAKKWPHVRGKITNVDLADDIFSFIRGQSFNMVYDYYVRDKLHSNDQFNPSKTNVTLKDLFHNKQLRNTSFTEIEGT